jgi:N-acetyl-anhydromuramyl-L-alanine amidase AmpD
MKIPINFNKQIVLIKNILSINIPTDKNYVSYHHDTEQLSRNNETTINIILILQYKFGYCNVAISPDVETTKTEERLWTRKENKESEI